MMHQPFTREQFTGDGRGARYRGPAGDRDLRVRSCASVAEAMLCTTSPLLMNDADRARFGRVEKKCGYRATAAIVTPIACWLPAMSISSSRPSQTYDVLALIPIIEGAGGIITTWENAPAAGRRPHHRSRR